MPQPRRCSRSSGLGAQALPIPASVFADFFPLRLSVDWDTNKSWLMGVKRGPQASRGASASDSSRDLAEAPHHNAVSGQRQLRVQCPAPVPTRTETKSSVVGISSTTSELDKLNQTRSSVQTCGKRDPSQSSDLSLALRGPNMGLGFRVYGLGFRV